MPRVSGELSTAGGVERSDRLQQADLAIGHEVVQFDGARQPLMRLPGDGPHEPLMQHEHLVPLPRR